MIAYCKLTHFVTGWEWDEEKIQLEKIPDDVALFFVATINTLDANVKLALSTLSCFGNSVECEVIKIIEADLGLNLTAPLDDAIHEGLLYKMNGRYCFGHDRIQEAAYSMIDKSDVFVHHVNYGVRIDTNKKYMPEPFVIVFQVLTATLCSHLALDVSFEDGKFVVPVHSSYTA